ncbi:MAG: hypothetical protein AAGK05_07660 [Pseudomonadota bacterium]
MLNGLSVHKTSPDTPIKLYKAAASILAKPVTEPLNQSLEKAEIQTGRHHIHGEVLVSQSEERLAREILTESVTN